MGHATRCVPIIKQFLKEGHTVIIGGDKSPLVFLRQEFPLLETITIPGYEVEYNTKGSTLKLFYESIKFYKFIQTEKQLIDKIIEEHDINMIVSDNRYGLYSERIESVIITHQLYVKAPIGEHIAHKKIEQLLGKFDAIWIPDYEGNNNLSGDLSHLKSFKQRHQFIGPLSRFTKSITEVEKEYDLLAIISGPEPQRGIFEEMVYEQMRGIDLKCAMVCGKLNEKENIIRDGIAVFNHLPTSDLKALIDKSKVVVCRAGYSSIMDLATLDKKAIFSSNTWTN